MAPSIAAGPNMAEPKHHRGESKQDFQTPPEFLKAVKARLGIQDFTIDLAADRKNRVTGRYYSIEQNALVQSWDAQLGGKRGWAWCNPPFSRIEPWVKKARAQTSLGVKTAMLLPAGVGANWFRDYVHGEWATVLFLNGRLTFVGQPTCYPKDCILLLWGEEDKLTQPQYEVWTWR